ncbi:MAG TPA: DeoR/GlpR family DNA-binding transcription regulator [Verrucomicrobiae bacterium]|nr:DeoR/GlpR family DNA-binding transcription regulator [Verrucomicrobiae bacterium]
MIIFNRIQSAMINGYHKELAPKRLDSLRELIRASGVIRIEEICQRLDISPATARRDLDELETAGLIRRVHGGAVSVERKLDEPLFDDKTSIAAQEKQNIARAALKFVENGDTIYLDGGSTVLELARLLRERTNITVVTNSLRAAHELAGNGPRLILISGELRRLSQTIVGPLTRFSLREIYVDKAFMGTMGLALKEGLTTTDPNEAFTKEFVMTRSRQVILLADSSKAGKVSLARAGKLENVHVIITDKQVDKKFAKELNKIGIKLIKA